MTLTILTGGISRLVHASPAGGAIFRLLPDGAAKSIRVIAASRVLSLPPDIGDVLTISGHYANDRKYGIQFVARTIQRAMPRGKDIVKLLTSHSTFAWIDATLARGLWRALGIELIAALQAQDYAAITSAAPISPSDAMRLVRDWRDYTRSISVSECFARHGLPLACVPKAIRLWGKDTEAHVIANPYSLVPIAGWGQIDDASTASLGLREDDDRRLVAACVSCAEEYVSRNRCMRMPVRLLTERIAARLGTSARAATAIQLALSHGRISIDGKGNGASAQPVGARLLEAAFTRRVKALLAAEPPMRDTGLSELVVMRTKSVTKGRSHAHPAFNLVNIQCYSALRSSPDAGHRAVHIFPSISMRDCIVGATHNSQLISEIFRSKDYEHSLYFIVYGWDTLDLPTATKLLYALPTVCSVTVVYPGKISCAPESFWHFLTRSNVASTLTLASWRRLRCGVEESIPPRRRSAGASNNLSSAGALHPSEPILPGFSESPQVHRIGLTSSSAALARALAAYREALDTRAAHKSSLNELPVFISSTSGNALEDGTWSDIFTTAFKAIGGPLGSGVHSIRRKFAEEWFRKEVQRCIDQNIPISYSDIVAGLARVLGHDSKLSQEAYRRASSMSRVTTPLDALTEENRELTVRTIQLNAQLVRKDEEVSRLRKLLADFVPGLKISKKLLSPTKPRCA